ncbi:MAG: PDZ domain-containing protein [bacterium]|nr:PDZ domain-containing protein [bacterium]
MLKKIKSLVKDIKDFIVEEYKFLIGALLILMLFFYPVNYYIIIGGGISDVGKRIDVVDAYDSEGSFNMSYVSELVGTLGPYLLSYIIPSWERESVDLYKYNNDESIEDIEFRSTLDLESANGNAIYWAYKLANKSCEITKMSIYVISVMQEYKSSFEVGDLLLSINGKSFMSLDEYQNYIQTFSPGDVVKIKVLRDDNEVEFDSKLYDYKGKSIMGVYLQVVYDYVTDPEVKLQFESDESGPSAGLITTLDIYNKLTKKDLTNSLKIAGTGTIESDGSIGQIGGVKYKLLGAVHGDADIFLVPSGDNYEECLEIAKKKNLKIKIIEVATIEEAIDKLLLLQE